MPDALVRCRNMRCQEPLAWTEIQGGSLVCESCIRAKMVKMIAEFFGPEFFGERCQALREKMVGQGYVVPQGPGMEPCD